MKYHAAARFALAKGGFLIVDDFHFEQEWRVFDAAMRKVPPAAGDYMEHSGRRWYAVDPTNEAFKFGVNYFIYGLTH